MSHDVTITADRHKELLNAYVCLDCLEQTGVEDWAGYSTALDLMERRLIKDTSPEEAKAAVRAQERR